MAKNIIDIENGYSPGDWIVHEAHGIGQIIAIERKSIGSKAATYYRIDTEECTVWVPVDDEGPLRTLAAPEQFVEATAVLERPSRQMSTNYRSRLARIRRARLQGTPPALARIVRDLWAREQCQGRLSKTEKQAWRDMFAQLLSEWSVSMHMEEKQTRKQIYSLLRQNALPAAASQV